MATESRCTIGDMNEASLLSTATSGETAAVDFLFIAHKEKLFPSVLRITRNHQDAEDAMQDSFLSAFLHLENFDGRSTFSTWLTRIGIHSAKVLRDIRDRHWRRRFSKLQNQLQL
jgi:DNA-directed RNA polymerase specialized sigma24 family protein